MFTYTFIFVACILLAVVAVYLYKAMSKVGKSVSRIKLSNLRAADPTRHLVAEPVRIAVSDTQSPWGRESRQTPENLAKTNAARPFEQSPWSNLGNGMQFAQHRRRKSPGQWAPYDTGDTESVHKRGQGSTWLHREDRFESNGKSYKVSRKLRPRIAPPKPLSKPSNW